MMSEDNSAQRDGGMDRLTEAVNEWARSRRSFMGDAAKIGGGALALSAGIGTAAADDGGSSGGFESMSDLEILNFALLLERLEATFYTEAVGTAPLGEESDDGRVDFDDDDEYDDDGLLGIIIDIDLGDDDDEDRDYSTYEYFQRIRNHEQDHVDALAGAIKKAGGDPVGNPGFTFPYDSKEEFVGLARVFEDTGAAAYTSAAPFIDNSAYVGPAAQILAVEARHASYLRSLNSKVPFPRSFQKTLTVAQIKDRIAPFIDN
jgi:hypothetical protein